VGENFQNFFGGNMPSYYLSEDLPRFGEVGKSSPKLFKMWSDWYAATMDNGALDKKTKALIALAVAHTVQCPYCIDAWTEGSVKEGATPEQMAEAVHVAAAIRGGSSLAHHIQSMNVQAREE
jgi:alkylhydroperoxidase/carboxymuconolactone decarboxylase family protein